MNEKIKNHLINYCKTKGYEATDESLIEVVTQAKIIYEGKRDVHRWYTLIPSVVQIDGMYLQYDYCFIHSEESSVEDCIGGYKLSDIIEVKPEIQPTTVYVPV